MAGFQASDTMPKMGHVTDLREQWLVRADGALAHRLQDREISSHLHENRHRNQLIREDFPVALNEQRDLEHEAFLKELAKRRQAETDAEIAREMAEINLRRQRRHNMNNELLQQPSSSRAVPMLPEPSRAVPMLPEPSRAVPLLPEPSRAVPMLPEPSRPAPKMTDINPEELGLSPYELEEMRRRLEQEEKDARLARQLSHEVEGQDALLADMRYAVEAQDSELARLLQEREYKKLQRAKEKARQKALLKKQQRLAAQNEVALPESQPTQTALLDAYSNPRDMIREQNLMREQTGQRLCKSVDSDLHYVEPFEKEHIQSKASALQSKEISEQYYRENSSDSVDNRNLPTSHSLASMQHRQPPPPPVSNKKPRFPDPVSIRPASHYMENEDPNTSIQSLSDNNNVYNKHPDFGNTSQSSHSRSSYERHDPAKRLSVISDITAEGLAKKKTKQKKGCKIQ